MFAYDNYFRSDEFRVICDVGRCGVAHPKYFSVSNRNLPQQSDMLLA
jgi:hypothetical protein